MDLRFQFINMVLGGDFFSKSHHQNYKFKFDIFHFGNFQVKHIAMLYKIEALQRLKAVIT